MPAAPRPKGKAKKIWENLLGNPLSKKRTQKEKIIDKRISSEEMARKYK